MQVGLLDQEVKEGYVAASKEAVLNYIMLDQVFHFSISNVHFSIHPICINVIHLRRKESD